jgi:branched-chain amino acid transport system ATP-binding protein
MNTLLALDAVTAGYAADIDILRGVTISAESGAITGLIGLNGAGKSTLMKTICGFLRPKTGRILCDGDDITGIAPHRVIDRGIWYISQESSLFPSMTVEDNLRLPLEHQRRRGAVGDDAAAARLVDTLARFPALREKLQAPAGDLSGGQQKMVEFAKAYLVQPRLCLIDEPSIGLSPKIAADVYDWIGQFAASGITILMVDHNVRRVVKMASRIYVLNLGEITAAGDAADFAGDLHEQVKAWLGINF